jgi:hypothetical protein
MAHPNVHPEGAPKPKHVTPADLIKMNQYLQKQIITRENNANEASFESKQSGGYSKIKRNIFNKGLPNSLLNYTN